MEDMLIDMEIHEGERQCAYNQPKRKHWEAIWFGNSSNNTMNRKPKKGPKGKRYDHAQYNNSLISTKLYHSGGIHFSM